MNSAQSTIMLITGANKGIGLAVTRSLAASVDGVIYAGARSIDAAHATAHELRNQRAEVRGMQLDVTDAVSIDAAAKQIAREHGRLDVLMNNAGIALDHAPPSATALDVFTRTFAVNLFGVIEITKAMIPLLRGAAVPRIVNVSSGLADPGYTATELNAFSGPQTVDEAAVVIVRLATLAEDGPTGGFFNAEGPLPW